MSENEKYQKDEYTYYGVSKEWVSSCNIDGEYESGHLIYHVYEYKPIWMGSPVAHYDTEEEARSEAIKRAGLEYGKDGNLRISEEEMIRRGAALEPPPLKYHRERG